MNILLINNNPLVSRMIDLCTRDEHIMLEEVESVIKVQYETYDVVFVDDVLYSEELFTLIDSLNIKKRVLISYTDEMNEKFDSVIKKPFLPSEIIELLQSVEKVEVIQENNNIEIEENLEEIESSSLEASDDNVTPSIFPLQAEEDDLPNILDSVEIDKIKELLLFENEENDLEDKALSDDEYEARKIEVIKEKLIADGLEIVDEEEIIEELSTNSNNSEIDLFIQKEKSIKNKKRKFKKDKKYLKKIKKAFNKAYKVLTKKEKKRLLKGKSLKITIKLEDKH